MRNFILRPGERLTIGDATISVDGAQRAAVAGLGPEGDSTRSKNPVERQTDRQWLADYEREERRLSGRRVM